MRRLLLPLLSGALLSGSTSYAADMPDLPDIPTLRLKTAVLSNYFTRYICISKFPEMQPQIQRTFEQSRFKGIPVPCRELQCTDPGDTRVLKSFLDTSRELSESRWRKLCSKYAHTVKELERDNAEALDALDWKPNTN